MASFKYVARDREGKSVSGVVDARDEAELRLILRGSDLFVSQIQASRSPAPSATSGAVTAGAASPGLFQSAKPSAQDMVIAIRQTATMIRSGIPVLQAIEIVAAQSTKPRLIEALTDIGESVARGQTLSMGMHRYPKIFSPLVVSLTEAGETAGTLPQTLEIAAKQLDREASMRTKVKSAMVYPKLVIVACFGTVAAMLIFVVPTFATVYKSFKADLPAPTLFLIAVSNFVCTYWWVCILLLVAGTMAYRKYKSTPAGKRRLDIISLHIPVLGPLLRKIAISRFVQTLGGSLSGGVPVLRCLSIAAATADNFVIRDAVLTAAQQVRDGATIGDELRKTGQFPVMVTRMIDAGEMSGNIDEMLEEISRFYEQDIAYAVEGLTKVVEPFMTVVVGSIVMVILLGLYMPIFNLGKVLTHSK